MIKKFLNFGIVGVLATVIDFAILYVLKTLLNVNLQISITIAFTTALIFNYLASMKFVFKAKESLSTFKQTMIFIATSLIGLLINQVIIYFCITFLDIYYIIAKLIATAVVTVVNFILRYLLLERS